MWERRICRSIKISTDFKKTTKKKLNVIEPKTEHNKIETEHYFKKATKNRKSSRFMIKHQEKKKIGEKNLQIEKDYEIIQ